MIRILGVVVAVFTMTVLAWRGFDLPFGQIFSDVLATLEQEAQPFFAIFEPWIKARLEEIRIALNWPLALHAHWKHVFILMWLYFGSELFSEWTVWRVQGDESRVNPWSLAVAVPVALAIAIIAGVFAGTIPLEGARNNVWILLIPVIAIFFNDALDKIILIAMTPSFSGARWQVFVTEIAFSLLRFVIGLVLVSVGLTITATSVKSIGIVLLAAYIFLLALISILQGLPTNSRVKIEVGKKILYVFLGTIAAASVGIVSP